MANILAQIKPVDAMFLIGQKLLEKEFDNVFIEFNGMDIFGFNNNGESTEIEVKTACYDLYKEVVNKKMKHQNYKKARPFTPTRFYFFINKNLEERARRFLKKHNLSYGLITYNPLSGDYNIAKKSDKLSEEGYQGELNAEADKRKHKRDKTFIQDRNNDEN